jgi:hypothetical protein
MVINDYKNSDGKWVRHSPRTKILTCTKAGSVWRAIRDRCATGGAQQERRPRYSGCAMSENFKNFQFFAEWCQSQIGYGLKNYHIDKDLLVDGNKLYSENTCVFVPAALNTFLCSHNASRGVYPQGVNLCRGKFAAQIAINGKTKGLGYYPTVELAYAAYKTAKETEARRWFQRLANKEFIVDPRVIERMRVWVLTEEQA